MTSQKFDIPSEAPVDQEILNGLIGIVTGPEFAAGITKAQAWNRIKAMADALDRDDHAELVMIASAAIHDSALLSRFRGNHESDHSVASAAHHLCNEYAERVQGHTSECASHAGLYSLAYNRATEGIIAPSVRQCYCDGLDSPKPYPKEISR
jgi:hypothetical protein